MLALLFDATPSHAWEAFTDSVTRGDNSCSGFVVHVGQGSPQPWASSSSHTPFHKHLHPWQMCSAHPSAECCVGLLLTLLMVSPLKPF